MGQKENDWRKTNQFASQQTAERIRLEWLYFKQENLRLKQDLTQLGKLTDQERGSIYRFTKWLREEVPKGDLCCEFNAGNPFGNIAKFERYIIRERTKRLQKVLSRSGRLSLTRVK